MHWKTKHTVKNKFPFEFVVDKTNHKNWGI